MSLEVFYWLLSQLVRVCRVNVPDASAAVVGAGEQDSLADGVPRKAVSFLLVPNQAEVGLHLVIFRRFRVLEIVEQVNFSADGLGGDDLVVLRHRSGSVHLSLVVYLNVDGDSVLLFSRDG